jgi:hypothetical protein
MGGSGTTPRQLRNNAVACARGLYNIEARPACSSSAAVDVPVIIGLSDGNRREVRTRADAAAPHQLWDADSATAARALPAGTSPRIRRSEGLFGAGSLPLACLEKCLDLPESAAAA